MGKVFLNPLHVPSHPHVLSQIYFCVSVSEDDKKPALFLTMVSEADYPVLSGDLSWNP